jgi:hypothetical protein
MMIFEDLYASKISFRISTFRDEGFCVELFDYRHGVRARATFGLHARACEWLREAAITHFPDSDFARSARGGALECAQGRGQGRSATAFSGGTAPPDVLAGGPNAALPVIRWAARPIPFTAILQHLKGGSFPTR